MRPSPRPQRPAVLTAALTPALAVALPLALAAGPAQAAGSGISVSTSGSTVSVTTTTCSHTSSSGSWGTAALLTSSQTSAKQGRQVALSGTVNLQSAAWQSVSPGTYTVIVDCSNGARAGSQSVIVSGTTTPTTSSTSAASSSTSSSASSATKAPSRGVLGGLGGSVKDYGPVTLGVGSALVGTGVIGAAWFLRRRAKPHRL
ncbi:hypothetical protein AB0465_12960 [Streptomyces griseoviridis]|uniref:hypothetical protein n=1 Tax=Streptomyces griseoviridis TaxID=45398 RepID=UPI00345089B4